MGLLIPCFLLLIIPGSVFSTKVASGAFGRSIYFYESISDDKLLLQWSVKNSPIAIRFPGYSPECNPNSSYTGRCQLYDNGTLRLDNLTFTDGGTYTFTVQQPPSTLVLESIYELTVYPELTAAVLSINGTYDRLVAGTYVSLHCDAGSQTVTNYTFKYDGKDICSESCKSGYLHFKPIKESDSGSYTCTIQNPVSSNVSNTLQLSVTVPVSDVKIISNISGLVWPGLDSVSLNCSAYGTNISYSWNLEWAPLPSEPQYHLTENNRILIINPVSDKENKSFTCTVSNWINNMTSNALNLSLASGVSNVTLTSNTSEAYIWAGEESASLHCSADGSEVTFSWYLNNQQLSTGPQYNITRSDSPPYSNLFISPVSRNDNGVFTCNASNRLGEKTSNELRLNLAWRPEHDIKCTAEPKGQNVMLGCSWPGGQPAANVSLGFREATDSGQNNVTLEVAIGGNLQGSTLTCLGDQQGKTAECSLSFGLPIDPHFKNNTLKTLKVGEDIVLTVNLDPALPASFSWNHPISGPIKMSRAPIVESTNFTSTLRIQSATVKDSGKYECRATNIIGTETFLFDVKVSESGLDGGAIAGIVIGVLAAVTLIGILVFFIVKKKKCRGDKKGINEPEYQQESSVQYATVQKNNGGIPQTSLENDQQEDDVKYAVIKFPNNSSKATVPPPVETEYSSIKPTIQQ